MTMTPQEYCESIWRLVELQAKQRDNIITASEMRELINISSAQAECEKHHPIGVAGILKDSSKGSA